MSKPLYPAVKSDVAGEHPAMSFDEIGARLGISRARAQQVFQAAMRKLQREAKRNDVSKTLREYAAELREARERRDHVEVLR